MMVSFLEKKLFKKKIVQNIIILSQFNIIIIWKDSLLLRQKMFNFDTDLLPYYGVSYLILLIFNYSISVQA